VREVRAVERGVGLDETPMVLTVERLDDGIEWCNWRFESR
jgi:hypothetical protein